MRRALETYLTDWETRADRVDEYLVHVPENLRRQRKTRSCVHRVPYDVDRSLSRSHAQHRNRGGV